MKKIFIALMIMAVPLTAPAQEEAAQEPSAKEEVPFTQVILDFEIGMLSVLEHAIKFDSDGTYFDYVDEGGQDIIFPFLRMSAELELDGAHSIIFLYQPINIQTHVALKRDIMVDTVYFHEGMPMDLRYGFDFYRLSYLYDFFGNDKDNEVAIGLSMQIRDAVIEFKSADGDRSVTKRDVGPVPALKFRGRGQWGRFWFGAEMDGMYAPIKYINGGSSDVEGAIIDLSLRPGIHVVKSMDVFLNLRYLGGGAEGTSKNKEDLGDGYTENWIQLLSTSIGIEWTPTDIF